MPVKIWAIRIHGTDENTMLATLSEKQINRGNVEISVFVTPQIAVTSKTIIEMTAKAAAALKFFIRFAQRSLKRVDKGKVLSCLLQSE